MTGHHAPAQDWLLLDGAQIDDLLCQLYTLEEAPHYHLLFQNTRYEDLADCGSVLVRLQANSPLQRVFKEQWQTSAGVWLSSDSDEEVLVEHLRSLVHVRLDGGAIVLLRYADPRILSKWLAGMAVAERDRVLGPIRCIRLATLDGEIEFVRQDHSVKPASYADEPWVHLDADCLDRLNQAKLECFDERLLKHMDVCFPEVLSGKPPAERLHWARTCRQQASAHGYSSARDVASWANLCALLGVSFPDSDGHQSYRDVLAQPTLTPAERLQQLTLTLQQQLSTTHRDVNA